MNAWRSEAAGSRGLVPRTERARAVRSAHLPPVDITGRAEVFLHSTPWMLAAHKLYDKLGFLRDPAHDWDVTPEVSLLAFRLPLTTSREKGHRSG